MNLRFKFDCEKEWLVVEVPPNLLLAYNETKNDRRNSIILYSILFVLSLFLYCNSQAMLLPIFYGNEFGAIFIITTIISIFLLTKWIFNKTPESIELFCCIMISDFDKYIDGIIDQLSDIISHNNRIKNGITEHTAQKIEKTIITAQKLKELNAECMDLDYDLRENIKLIESNIDNLYGLKIKKVTYNNEKKNTKRRKRGRNSTFSIHRSNNDHRQKRK